MFKAPTHCNQMGRDVASAANRDTSPTAQVPKLLRPIYARPQAKGGVRDTRLGRGTHAKDRVLRCDRLELAERCSPVDGEVCACAAGHLEVSLQDRRPLARLDFLEGNRLAPSVPQHRPSAGGPHVRDPVGAFAEHRDEIPLAIDVCDDNGERPQATAAASADLERREPVRPNARRVESRLSAVEQTCEPVGATTGVEPASRGRAHRAHVASLRHVQRMDIRGVPQRWVAHYETPMGHRGGARAVAGAAPAFVSRHKERRSLVGAARLLTGLLL
jgi:hypothetical protein